MPQLTSTQSAPNWADWEPPADVYDDGDAYSIVLEVPGVTQASLSIVQTANQVVVTGVRALNLELGAHPHIEADYGRFHRQIDLPTATNPAGRDVTFSHGLLTIHLPKCPQLAST
jgi:HSP20 family protein